MAPIKATRRPLPHVDPGGFFDDSTGATFSCRTCCIVGTSNSLPQCSESTLPPWRPLREPLGRRNKGANTSLSQENLRGGSGRNGVGWVCRILEPTRSMSTYTYEEGSGFVWAAATTEHFDLSHLNMPTIAQFSCESFGENLWSATYHLCGTLNLVSLAPIRLSSFLGGNWVRLIFTLGVACRERGF